MSSSGGDAMRRFRLSTLIPLVVIAAGGWGRKPQSGVLDAWGFCSGEQRHHGASHAFDPRSLPSILGILPQPPVASPVTSSSMPSTTTFTRRTNNVDAVLAAGDAR